jgi:hypothetical protein
MTKRRTKIEPSDRAIIAAGEAAVERAQKTFSKQPRFTPDSSDRVMSGIMYWIKQREIQQVPYQADSRARDRWLRDFWKLEPHWSGVLNSICLVDSNRGWTLTGGRNQVYRYMDMLHDAEGGQGWRTLMKQEALSYHTADMCSVWELGRDGPGGPLRALYHVDPVRCRLTGQSKTPLEYTPASGTMQKWGPSDFFRLVSMPSNDESMNGLGFCSTSRAVEIVTLLYSVLLHDQEKLGARMPQGLLLLQGVSETQWRDALAARREALDAENRARFGGVMVFAQEGMEQIDAKIVALSSLPDNFDRKTFLDQCLYAYALVTGYDPREFWPVSGGQLGTATETETQHMKATGKGGMDFVLSVQERLQRELPDTIEFQFEQRDDAGSIMEAQVAQAWAEVAKTLHEAGQAANDPLLDKQHALSLLADHGVIPPEWTEMEEETHATDTAEPSGTEPEAEAALATERVRRAMDKFPDEAIVQYRWPSERVRVLREATHNLPVLVPGWRQVRRVTINRADDILYKSGDVVITQADVDRAIAVGRKRTGDEFASLLTAQEYVEPK